MDIKSEPRFYRSTEIKFDYHLIVELALLILFLKLVVHLIESTWTFNLYDTAVICSKSS